MKSSEKGPNKYGKSVFREGLEEWIDKELVPRPFEWMEDLENKAREDRFPVLSPASGAVLAFLARSWNPEHVLELGTGYGVSLVWLYSALGNTVRIVSVDREKLFSGTAWEFLQRIDGVGENVELRNADCVEYLDSYLDSKPPDGKEFLFVDCDKVRYPEIFSLLSFKAKDRRVRVVFDNVLWHGRIADPERQAPSDEAVRELWSLVKTSGLTYTLFPAGDGILCIDFSE